MPHKEGEVYRCPKESCGCEVTDFYKDKADFVIQS
jgi:hypothetical protein